MNLLDSQQHGGHYRPHRTLVHHVAVVVLHVSYGVFLLSCFNFMYWMMLVSRVDLFLNGIEGQWYHRDLLLLLLPIKPTGGRRPLRPSSSSSQDVPPRKAVVWPPTQPHNHSVRVLYIVTSIHEWDNGRRQTIQGHDRFTHTLAPVLKESVTSMLSFGYEVDVYLITHYPISVSRYRQIRQQLPDSVGLQVWDDATPIGYDTDFSKTILRNVTRALARQHRYVIKDKIFHYDLFVNFEDDMLIKGVHVQHFVEMTNELFRLRRHAPLQLYTSNRPGWDNATTNTTTTTTTMSLLQPIRMSRVELVRRLRRGESILPTPPSPGVEGRVPTPQEALTMYYGPMTQMQLRRMIPGFIRVEVAFPNQRPSRHPKKQKNKWQSYVITPSYNWTAPGGPGHPDQHYLASLDPSICCKVSSEMKQNHDNILLASPSNDDLYMWETQIEALGIRKLPLGSQYDWVLLQGGNVESLYVEARYVIGDYWTGRGGQYGTEPRPDRTHGQYLNNQGGWMATRRQVAEWHASRCRGGFLPPYDIPIYPFDGLDSHTVEYWSGGIHIAGVMSCNLQRVIALDPTGFSKHLLYHTSNNKHRWANVQYKFSGLTVNEFWGQLNTIRLQAEAHMQQEVDMIGLHASNLSETLSASIR